MDEKLGYHYPLITHAGEPLTDIHSIRVFVITTLLELGVPISALQILVGHKAPGQTWYYEDIKTQNIHQALQLAFEKLKARLLDPHALSRTEVEDFLGSVITHSSQADFTGPDMLRRHRAEGALIDVFAHGICPGGNCEEGGDRIAEGRYGPVWRPRACSGCRFRLTGPAFLNGLIQRANSLMWEILRSVRMEGDLNAKIERHEDEGRSSAHLRGDIRKEQEKRENLWREWGLESITIRKAIEALRNKHDDPSAQSLATRFDPRELDVRLGEMHDFELAQTIVEDFRIIEACAFDMPPDVEMYRDKMIRKIARENSIQDMLLVVDDDLAATAFDLFGRLIISHAGSSERIEKLINGTLLVSQIPELDQAIQAEWPAVAKSIEVA